MDTTGRSSVGEHLNDELVDMRQPLRMFTYVIEIDQRVNMISMTLEYIARLTLAIFVGNVVFGNHFRLGHFFCIELIDVVDN